MMKFENDVVIDVGSSAMCSRKTGIYSLLALGVLDSKCATLTPGCVVKDLGFVKPWSFLYRPFYLFSFLCPFLKNCKSRPSNEKDKFEIRLRLGTDGQGTEHPFLLSVILEYLSSRFVSGI